MPLLPDEAYYWVWSRALAPGYLDHPPMVALWIAAGTALAGEGALGVRLLAPLAAALGSLLLADATRRLLPGNEVAGREAGVLAAALLNATLFLAAGSVTMTPDTPLLFFWTAAIWALARLNEGGDARWWLAAGLFIGAAGASKYSALLITPAIVIWVLAIPAHRRWLLGWQIWAGTAIAAAVVAPVLAWNAAHGWASMLKQGGRGGEAPPLRVLQFLAELVAGQVALATPVIATLCAAGLLAALRLGTRERPGFVLIAGLAGVPAVVFTLHALGERVQANWPGIAYPAACIAAAALAGRWHRWFRPGVALGFGMTGAVWLQATLAPLPLPMRLDPTLLRLAGWQALAADIAATARQEGIGIVASTNYSHAALLARLLPPDLEVVGLEGRWALFRLPDARPLLAGRPLLLLHSARRDERLHTDDLTAPRQIATLTRGRPGLAAEDFRLYRATGRHGEQPAALMPRPLLREPSP
jgi:4-amino-4-deoxy-L-arabinose transferase-like glycosyltransferase